MERPTLVQSAVIFNEAEHTYTLNGKRLSGITKRIQDRLFPEMYSAVDDDTLRTAAEYGSFIHAAIYKSQKEWPPERIQEAVQDIHELADYFDYKDALGLVTLDSEYNVTDGLVYASNIDEVAMDRDGGIVLIDFKTSYNPKKDYTRVQLSTYKYLFELQNPGLKVTQLVEFWLRDEPDKGGYYTFKPVPEETVKSMLYNDDELSLNNAQLDAFYSFEETYYENKRTIARLQEENKRYEATAKDLMLLEGETRWQGTRLRFTYTPASTKKQLNQKLLKERYPDVYADCVEEVESSARLTTTEIKEQ